MHKNSLRSLSLRGGVVGGAIGLARIAALPSPAHACGVFCSATNPVNQAAEQIIFSQNDDGTVTAVIQIMYEGPVRALRGYCRCRANRPSGCHRTKR